MAETEPRRLERLGTIASDVASLRPADTTLRYALYGGLTVLVAASIVVAVAGALGQIPDLDWHFRPLWLSLGILGFCALVVAESEVWRRLLAALGPRISFRRGLSIWSVSALGRYVPTSILVPVMRMAMAERAGVPKRVCLASVVYETALWMVSSLAVGAYFVLQLDELQGEPARFSVILIPIVALISLHPRIFHRLANRALDRLGRERLPVALSAGNVVRFAVLYTATIVFAGLCVYPLAASVAPLDAGDLVTVVGAFAAGTALSMLAFLLPGGILAREAGLALALSPIMPAASAILVALIVRIVQIGTETLFAIVAPLLARGKPELGAPADCLVE